jgi:hypothetical protein
VEKDILVSAVRGDEAKTLFVVKALDYSCHMIVCLRINSANRDLFAEISTNFQEGVICLLPRYHKEPIFVNANSHSRCSVVKSTLN